jgi:hypothetical protein
MTYILLESNKVGNRVNRPSETYPSVRAHVQRGKCSKLRLQQVGFGNFGLKPLPLKTDIVCNCITYAILQCP